LLYTHPPTTANYTLSLHDALPILAIRCRTTIPTNKRSSNGIMIIRKRSSASGWESQSASCSWPKEKNGNEPGSPLSRRCKNWERSEEHTSELQSRGHLVCRLLLEK